MKRTSSRLAGVVLLATMLLALVMPAAAKPVDAARAEQVARNFWNAHRDNGVVALSQPMQQLQLQWDGFYCFVSGEATGFVIVAADDCVQPVLGYSFHNPASAQPGPEVSYWLGYYQRQIDFMRAEGWMPSDAVQAEWRTLTESKAINPTPLTAVSPMLTTQWGQSPLYNNLCPDSSGVHAVVGCVATAMAQIMKYWNHPTMGTGSHSYTHPQFGTVSANFGNTTYAWNNMPNSLSSSSTTAQINAVATLSYHCGVAVEMDYGIGGSGAWTTNGTILSHACSQNAFVKYFGYSSHVEGRIHDDMTESAWSTAIRNELNAQRPVLFTGSDEGGGHAFVCDGYNNSNQYHFNWGWHGYYDGYFSLSNLDPEGGGTGSNNTNTFNYNQDILVGLQPATTANNDAGCVIRQFPYSANFDYGMPACWEVVNSQGDIYSWMRYEELGVNGSTCLFATASWNETATDAYLILPAIETPGTYTLTYKVAAYSSNAPSYALYTTDNYPDIYESVTNTTFQTRTDTFVVAAGSSVNPMFRYISQNYGDNNSDYLLLDDVSIYQLSVDTTTSPLTNCVITSLPYIEDFEGDLPCLGVADGNGNDTIGWYRYNGWGYNGSKTLACQSFADAYDLLYLPRIATPGNITFSWKARTYSPNYPEVYQVWLLTSSNSTLLYSETLSDTIYVSRSTGFTLAAGDTARIAIRTTSFDGGYLFLDDLAFNYATTTPQYTLTVVSTDESMGTVWGGGTYAAGSTATIGATCYPGYVFDGWNDGILNNPRTVTVTSNATYYAYFYPNVEYYIVNVAVNDATMGSVYGSGEYEEGTIVTLTAVANNGYHFVAWSDGNMDNPRTITVNGNITLIANFAADDNTPQPVDTNTCVINSFPYSENFDGESLYCWGVYDANQDADYTSYNNKWFWYNSIGYNGSLCFAIANTNSNNYYGDYLISPYIATPGTYTVSWKAKSYFGSQLNYYVYAYGVDTNVQMLTISDSNWGTYTYTFTLGAGDTTQILFEFASYGGYLCIDDFSITVGGTTPQNNTLTAINDGGGYMYVSSDNGSVSQFVTAGTYTFSVPTNENAYVEFATLSSNFQYLSNLVSIGMNPNALTLEHIYLDGVEIPLTTSNNLEIYDEMSTEGVIWYELILPGGNIANHTVRAVYGSGSTPTPDPCVIASLPYTQDFENGAECWTVQDYNGNDTTWGLINSWGYNGSKAAYVATYQDAGDLLFTPSFVVPGTHTLTFKARGYSAQYVEKFQVWDLYDTNAVLLITDSVADSNYHTYSVNFTIAQGDTHQLAFRSIWYSAYLFIDDVVISTGGTTPQYYTITAQSANPNIGYVTGGGQYVAGSTVTLTAVPYSGYRFASWGDGVTSNPRTITVNGNATYVAYFDVDNTTYNTLTATNDGGGYMYVYNEDENVVQFITAGTQTISIPSNDYVVVQLATFGSNFQDLSVLVNQLGMNPNALTLTHLYYDNVEISLTDTNQLYIFNEMSTEGYIMYILLVPGSANHTVRAVYGNGSTPQNVANVTFQCQGNGSVYRANTSVNNLCGQTDQVAYNQQQGGFMASYDFVPANGGTLTHLYVNNVDRINDVTNYTASGVSLSRWNFFSATNTALSVVPVFTSGSVTYNTLTVTNVGGGYMYIFNEDETIDEFIVTSTTQTISIASDDAAIVQLVTFNSNYPYLSDLINEGMNPNAMTLMHLYYDGVEIPLTSSNQNLQIYNNLSSNGYIVYNLTVPGSANHTVRAVYGSGSTPTPDPCVITSLPYTQDFENGAECWTVQDYNGNDTTWGLINSWGYNGSRAAYVGSYQDAGDLLFTPSFVVPGTHTLTFKARGYSAQYVEKFQVWDLYDTNAVLLITDSVADSIYHTYSVNFTIAQGDTHQLAFRSIWYSAYLFIDDVVISTGGTPQPSVANVTFQCQGNGQAYRAGNRNNSLCGQTDQVAYNQQQNAFMASYEFIPNNGSELTHLYVNNVDRVSETVTRYSGNSVIVSWNMRTQDSQVTVRPVFAVNCNNVEVTNNVTACDSYTWFGITYVESGVYTHVSYGAANGCDSIYHLNLTLGQSYIDTTHMRVRQQYTWEGQTYNQSGTFIKRYTTVLGCDSIRVLELTVDSTLPCDDIEAYLEMKACESYLWYGTTYVENGVYEHIEHGVVSGGCDSVYHLVLSIGHPTVDTVEAYLPEGGTYEFGGQTFNRPGTFILGGTNVYGCDSTVVLVLTNNNAIASPDAYGVSLTVYPNPTRGEVTVSATARIERVEVMDALGRMVRSTVPAENGTEMRLDMTALPAGTYMIRITTAEGTVLQRLLKQ